jgi:hypothetical protein
MSIAAQGNMSDRMDLTCFTSITSKEFMQKDEKQHSFLHSIFQKEVLR